MVSNEIEYKRKNLIQVAKEHGINAEITLKCSQELDMLLLKQIRESIKKTDLLKKSKYN
ncbi:aspartyl-phosphate phosphatase Spo0E family protein [Metabacillus herbersteinensis]|uniref:Aspartyl-phosphate phosphatase Spo0E family protein n=2 Tax=Metabacillus herbersteinensis TaxID=283816 RepID=A0ABV6GQ47_9BACI